MRNRNLNTWLLCTVLSLFILAGAVPPPRLASQEAPYVFIQSWGGEIGVLDRPTGAAVHGDRVYIIDSGRAMVQVFDLHGVALTAFDAAGDGDGQFQGLGGIAVDASGNVYVTEMYDDRVQKFAPDGTYLTQWGSQGSGDGQFSSPEGIAVDVNGNIYVADTDNHRIQTFTSDGTYLTQWGGYGSGDGQFHWPAGVAVDSGGNVYVADTLNDRIQKFAADGSYLTQWGSEGSRAGQFSYPKGIAVDEDGNVYVADAGDVYVQDIDNHRIQKFAADGTYLDQWGSQGTGDGQFSYPEGITVDASGSVYVADTYNSRIQKFATDGTYLTQWGRRGSGPGQFSSPQSIAIDASGNVYVADADNHRVQKFTSDGTYLTKWGSQGGGDGEFDYPNGIAVDASGNVFVADGYNHRIQKFASDGTYLAQWGSAGYGPGQFYSLTGGIAVDASGNVYVADGAAMPPGIVILARIQKFTADGTYLTQWGSPGSGDGQFLYPYDIAVDASGNVYVVDAENHRVQKFTADGTYLTQWGSEGSGDGQFDWPEGVAVDASGHVYVADTHNSRIQKFTPDGTYLSQWGSYGRGDGQFDLPRGVAVDANGNVYVAGVGDERIQKFATTYPAPDPVHGLALNGSFEETPDLVRWTYGGTLPVDLVTDAAHGTRAARLGAPTPPTAQGRGMAWLYQTIYIRPEWERPVLTYRYRMFLNDTLDYSDLHVWLTRSDGARLAEIQRDGFRSCTGAAVPPPAGYDLGWRADGYDLSAFQGQTVRVVFENRNLHADSWGIWTYLDDVRVVDAGPPPALPGSYRLYWPQFMTCDRVASR